MISTVPVYLALAGLASVASAHVAFWHKSMYGFNVTDKTYSYDNRPQVPLYSMTFDQWWFHGHKDHPPNQGDFFELPAGGKVNSELSCDKGATSWYNSSQGGAVGYGSNSPCPGAPLSAFHTTGLDDVTGCALAIAYQPDVNAVKPDDFVIFSVNHTCVWTLNTEFDVPQLPACPEGGCHCAWFWIHSYKSGGEQIYMNAFKCKVTGNVGNQPLGKPALPRRCGPDPDHDNPNGTPGNCTVGAKVPMYWYNKEGNNMFEGTYDAPYYNDLYGFHDGAQNDIFQDGVIASLASSPVSQPTTKSNDQPVPTPTTTQVVDPPKSTPSTTVEVNTPPPQPTTTTVEANPAPPQTTTTKVEVSAPVDPSIGIPVSISVGATTTASNAGSTAKCKRRDSTKKHSQNRKHARHLSGIRH